METNQVKCQNCEKPFKKGFEFCPHCGQKTNEELTVGVLFYNTISNYFSFDARFLKSFFPLMVKPGYLAKEFIKGKRLLYLHPAQMYLFISVIFFFLFSFTVREQTDTLNKEFKKTLENDELVVMDSLEARRIDSIKQAKDSIVRLKLEETLNKNKFITGMTDVDIDSLIKNEELTEDHMKLSFGDGEFQQEKVDSLIEVDASDAEIYKAMGLQADAGWFKRKMYAQGLKLYKARDGGNVLKAFYDTIPIALFFLLPLFALILKLLYYNKGRYAHHLVFSFYFFSFLFTVFTIILGINRIWEIPDWIDWLVAMSTFFYLLFALKRFYGQGWFFSIFKCSVATFTFMAVIIPVATAIIFLFAFMFY